VVLCWHVPYWDRLGWKDPYGDDRHTARQRRYQIALKLRGLQTPHLFVGNKPVRSRAEINSRMEEDGKQSPQLDVNATAAFEKGKVKVSAQLKLLDKEFVLDPEVTLQPVLFQRKVVTKCDAGENKGRTLTEYFVVVAIADAVPASKAIEKALEFNLAAPKGIKAADLGLALLVEQPDKMKTLECWHLPVTESK
jgi:hypothetical protein